MKGNQELMVSKQQCNNDIIWKKPILEEDSQFKAECLRRARLLGDWCIANQEQDIFDANYGRFIDHYHPTEKWPNGKNLFLTGSMMTTMGINFLLMLHDRTCDDRYLDAAVRCGEYVKTLQSLYPGRKDLYGTFSEFTYQLINEFPKYLAYRSTTVAADGFLLLYEKTGKQEYLDRAKIFAEWFLYHAVSPEGWITEYGWGMPLRFYFEMGNLLFFYHLYKFVQDDRYLEMMRKMCEFYMKNFLTEDGQPAGVLEKEIFEKKVLDEKSNRGWWRQHLYNDDFSGISLIGASHLLNEPRYLEPVKAYAEWLLKEQNEEGGYGQPSLWVGSATVPILFCDLYRVTGEQKYLTSSRQALKHLMTLQEFREDDVKTRWAIYENNEYKNSVSVRTCAYGAVALLKYESAVAGPYLSVFNQKGEFYVNR